MSLRVLKAATEAENSDDLHLARLLLLLSCADASRKTPETKAKAIEGITKLAKLDFLLRYPVYLERALVALEKSPDAAAVLPRERTSVETKMIRFRYGPWDGRYRRWLGLLSARGLINLSAEGRKIEIGLTDRGRVLAEKIATIPEFQALVARSNVVIKNLGNMPAMKLKDFVYQIVPEIRDIKWGEEIAPALDRSKLPAPGDMS